MRQNWSLTLLWLLALAACARPGAAPQPTAPAAAEVTLNHYGPAPELTNDVWLNTGGQTLRLADLRGKVVALEMWTFG